jgi:peptidoglycan/xylan/chitin deacetylase (PgdA/CDA1 family)
MKILKNSLIVLLTAVLLAASFFFFYVRPRYVVPILMYHGITDSEAGSMYVNPRNFSRQMDFLKKEGYSVISLNDLVEGIREGVKFGPGTVVITFDDGYEDNYLYAFPILAKYSFPATVFLITGYIDKKEGYLTWDQARVMVSNGIDLGGHTRNNMYLPSISDTARLWEEIAGSKKDIQENTQKSADYFCYPIGGFNDKIKNAVIKAGYKGACTTNRGRDRYNNDVFELNRVKVTNSDINKPFHFRAKLSGYYNLFRSLKKPE